MIGVLFEVYLKEDKMQDYLTLAADLLSELEKIEGFISIERFQSFSDTTKILSMSMWENEEAVAKWRTNAKHRETQGKGRATIFEKYKITVVRTIREYTNIVREQAPEDSNEYFINKNG